MVSRPSSNPSPPARRRLALLDTRVARQMLALFLLCALLPTVLLAVIGYHHVSSQLNEQGRERLRELSRATGMAMVERLQIVEDQVRAFAAAPFSLDARAELPSDEEFRLKAMSVFRNGASPDAHWGTIGVPLPQLDSAQRRHLATGRALIVPVSTPAGPAVLMGLRLAPGNPAGGIAWAELQLARLWGPPQEENSMVILCVFTAGGTHVLTCPGSNPAAMAAQIREQSSGGDLEWSEEGNEYVAGYWSAFLGFQWGTPSWVVAISEPHSRLLAPVTRFARTFVLVILLALVLVFLVSNVQIRRRMEPLARLQEGTLRVAAGDFIAPVTVASGDEFEQLADSFNIMAQRLGRQFTTLNVINDISRAALSDLKIDRMIDTVLERFGETIRGAETSLLLPTPGTANLWCVTSHGEAGRTEREVQMKENAAAVLHRAPAHLWLSDLGAGHAVANAFPNLKESARVLLLPLRDHEELSGLIAITFSGRAVVSPEEVAQSRQLADQVTVALANTRLMERLEQLSWGALSALARTIDANSPWTAGHSERVTLLSLAIGRELGLPASDLDALHRGGLLHDIGKIGIPPAVLDKAGKLTDEEMEIIRTHPAVGARILAPLAVFRDIIPIVRHHHEKFDGTGYPDRLAGTAIPFLARVLAVADVYDALISDRPYRPGWTREAAVELIRKTTSAHHDPVIVQAFLSLLAKGELDHVSALPSMNDPVEEDSILLLGAAS